MVGSRASGDSSEISEKFCTEQCRPIMFQMPEEDSFAVLVKIMQDYRMREMFKPSMAELGLCMYQLDTLVQEHIPDLYVHFQSQVNDKANACLIYFHKRNSPHLAPS